MSEKFRLDRKVGFQNMFYTKCINDIIYSIGPSIILWSIYAYSLSSNSSILTLKYDKLSLELYGFELILFYYILMFFFHPY